MEAGHEEKFFGPQSDPRSQIGLPAVISAGKPEKRVRGCALTNNAADSGRCMARIFGTGSADATSWYELWGEGP